jgi:hypothetical protein
MWPKRIRVLGAGRTGPLAVVRQLHRGGWTVSQRSASGVRVRRGPEVPELCRGWTGQDCPVQSFGVSGRRSRRAAGLEAEGTPGVVQAIRVCEADVAACGAVLGVTRLHPEDVRRYAGLSGNSEAAHASAGRYHFFPEIS